MKNKYNYYKVIQGNYGDGWNDEDFHPCNSRGVMDRNARAYLKENLKLYREDGVGNYRVIFRKEKAE